jgi:hypothetical protein
MRALTLLVTPLLLACSDYEYAELGFDDEFYQAEDAPPADVLFVIDNSASMAEEASRLATNFEAFVAVLTGTTIDFQLGVTSTDPEAPASLTGPILTQDTPRIGEAFLAAVAVGTEGSRDEMGLARAAEVTRPANTPGFVRPGSTLAIVVFSDEDDHSPGAVVTHVDALFDRGASDVSVHAIAGDLPDGCASGISAADPASRYVEAAVTTGGLVWSICDDDYTAMLTRVAFEISGWSDTFYLSHLPEEETLRVWVDGVELPRRDEDGWTWSIGDNAIVFTGRAVPRPGMRIDVRYEIAEGTVTKG